MPLSLRRAKKSSQPTPPSRAVSQPTLLHQLRSSVFNSSKDSLISTSRYDSVRSRTPPRTDPPQQADRRLASRRTREYRAIHAGWRISAQRLTKVEQRECLLAAECLNILDPLEGSLDSPNVSLDSVLVVSDVFVTQHPAPSARLDSRSEPPLKFKRATLPPAKPPRSSPLISLFQHSALRNRRPLTSTYTPNVSSQIPGRTTAASHRPDSSPAAFPDRNAEIARPFGSPVMVPIKPPSTPRPRSPTPDRMSSPPVSPGWTHVTPHRSR